MSKKAIAYLVAIVAGLIFVASVSAQRSAEEQFLEQEQGWMDALAKKDAVKLETILAPEFTIVGVGSTAGEMVGDRAGWLKLSGKYPGRVTR